MTGTHCNCELAAEFDSPLSLISYHMRLLQMPGWCAANVMPTMAAGSTTLWTRPPFAN